MSIRKKKITGRTQGERSFEGESSRRPYKYYSRQSSVLDDLYSGSLQLQTTGRKVHYTGDDT
jgi:hypothetical protein